MHKIFVTLLALQFLVAPTGAEMVAAADQSQEPPIFMRLVAQGKLPPMEARLPEVPRRDLPEREGWVEGQYGGNLTLLSRGGRDPRDLVLLGYARLVVWNEAFELVPDILESVEVVNNRQFTLRLRAGHRWSDGHPFTSEDFRFWWEEVANNRELSPVGPPKVMQPGGEQPNFEVIDETTVRYTWEEPNPNFLPALAAASPLFIYRPAHYLRRHHADHSPRARLDQRAQDFGLKDWRELFRRLDRMFRFDNPELPTLQPWVNRTAPPTDRFLAERNPYFHRADTEGRQLPYIDRIELRRSEAKLIPVKAAAGEAGLQARGLSFADYTALKEAEAQKKITVHLWPIGRGAQLTLYPNLNAVAPVWRDLLRDVRFRRALSLAIDREEIISVIYQGLAIGGGNGVLPNSPLYDEEQRARWSEFDLKQADDLLDEIGLARSGEGGPRLLPDGRPLEIIVETADVDPVETDVLELIATTWERAGIRMLIKPIGRQAAGQRVRSGVAVMTLFYGLANGLAVPSMSPEELAPTSDRQRNWPLWGLFFKSGGKKGEAPQLVSTLELLRGLESWRLAEDDAARRAAWSAMLEIHADQVFSIGIVGQVMQPIVTRRDLRNIPKKAPYLYDPGAYFGIYRPDTFWIESKAR